MPRMALHGIRQKTIHKAIIFVALVAAALIIAITVSFCSKNQQDTNHVVRGYIKQGKTEQRSCQTAGINRIVRLPSVCFSESCRSDYVGQLQEVKSQFPIPAIRHILWRNESVSEYFVEQLRTWLRIHPDWTYVLWRDQDLEPFVTTYSPGLVAKFRSLGNYIMKVDMIRYMILFRYGGTYADLDYRLVRSLDEFRRFHAVITREPDSHSLEFLGMTWPVKPLASPAFLMSAPGHAFYHFALQRLQTRNADNYLHFAGPLGLTAIVDEYRGLFPIANHVMETVYIPPSYSFYPYPNNRLNNSRSRYLPARYMRLDTACKSLKSMKDKSQQEPRLRQFCSDVDNLDSITDKSQLVFAIHDLAKPGSANDGSEVVVKFFAEKLTDAKRAIKNLKLGNEFMMSSIVKGTA